MVRLGQADLRKLFEALVDLYAVHEVAAYPDHLLALVSSLIPNDSLTYNEIHASRQPTRMRWRPGPPPVDCTPAFDRFKHQHPVIKYVRRTLDGQATALSDVVSKSAFEQTELYNEYYRTVYSPRWRDQLDLTPIASPKDLLTIAVNRTGLRFSPRDKQVLNLLAPHIRQARRNAEAMSQWKEQAALLQDALHRSGQAMVAVSEKGQIGWMTSHAKRLMDIYWPDGCRRADRLPATLRAWVREQVAALGDPERLPPPLAPLLREGGQGILQVRCMRERAYTVLCFEEQSNGPALAVLQRAGLTRREAEVLQLLTLGRTNPDIAGLLRISPRTVQSLVQRIFDKLGVETRTAAATRALEMRRA